jgi:RNA polymerase sigma-70 factor, ECF subfamily
MLAGLCTSRADDAPDSPGDLYEVNSRELSLVERARAGDEQAFEALIQRYRRIAYITIFKITRHHEDAEDTLQDAILNVYTHLEGFEGKSRFGTWFVAIAANQALMYLRRKRTRERCIPRLAQETEELLLPNLPDERPGAEEEMQQLELACAIRCAAGRLPQSLQATFLMRFVEELSTQQTAEELNVSPSAVKSRIARAKRRLRRELGNYLSLTGCDG